MRFGPISAKNDVTMAPSNGDLQLDTDVKESSCCCGVTSRIPLPTGSNNRHTTGATCLPRIQAPVYRSSLDWSNRVQKSSSGCFGKLSVDRVPLVSKICEDSKSLPLQDQETTTLDRFQRFRFGGRNGRGGAQNKKNKQNVAPRTTDKSDRLRKLTDKLKQPPASEVQTSEPKDENLMGSKATSTANLSGEESSDKFDDGIRKPEARTIVGSYYQRSIPFRSASFSQVYYSPSDGKYIRSDGRKRSTPNPVSLSRKAHSSEPVRAYSEDHDDIEVPTPPRRKNKSKSDPTSQSDVAIIEETLEISVHVPPEQVAEKTFLSEWKSETDGGIVQNIEASTTNTPAESPKEEPQSPEFPQMPQWSSLTELPLLRPKLSAQSSEEKDEEKVCSSPKVNYRKYLLSKGDSFSEGDSDQGNHSQTLSPTRECTSSPCNDNSDSEKNSGPPVPYSKRPLRGPYLEMIVNEKKKPEVNGKKQDDLKFLDEYPKQIIRSADDCQLKRSYTSPDQPSDRLRLRTSPKRKTSTNIPLVAVGNKNGVNETMRYHQRTTSSPSQLEGCARVKKTPEPSPQLLAQLLKGSSEQVYGGPLTNPLKVNIILQYIIIFIHLLLVN